MAKGHKTTDTHAADAATTAMQNRTYGAAQNAAQNYQTVGADPNTLAAMGLFNNYAQAGQQGMSALGGDQSAQASLMNPYIDQVLGGVNSQYGQDTQMLNKNINDTATQSGAFGGDRASLERGAAQGQLALGHQQQVGDILHGGYNEMLQRAAGLAGFGMDAGNAQMAGGDYLRNIQQQQANPDLARQQILASGMQGGNAGNYTNSTYTKTSAAQNILGAAATFGPMFFGMPPNPAGLSAMSGGGDQIQGGFNSAGGLFGNSGAAATGGSPLAMSSQARPSLFSNAGWTF